MYRLRALKATACGVSTRQPRCWATSGSALLQSSAERSSSFSLGSVRWHSSGVKKPQRHQYISLYNYTPLEKEQLPKLRRDVFQAWTQLEVLGRIYISQEGINAQLVLPETKIPAFKASFPTLLASSKMFYGQVLESGGAGSRGHRFENHQEAVALKAEDLFQKLDIRIRDQIVRDGFEKGHLDLQDSGNALPPHEWHEKLHQRNASKDASTLVLDVRNFYEHDIGRFDGATRIMVDTFRDTFDAVDEILEQHEAEHNGESPREVMMYCTGGIRCEKVGAYLSQYKGIKNVQKLHGGIVNYVRFLKESEEEEGGADGRSLFKGKNFVFDQRCVTNGTEAEEVTSDVLGECFQCGEPCNQHTNCRNLMCGGLILQCRKCSASFHGACSDACKHEVLKMNTLTPQALKKYRKQHAERWKPAIPNALPKFSKHIKIRPIPPSMRAAQSFCTHADRRSTPLVDEKEQLNRYVNRKSTAHEDEQLLAELREATVREWPKAVQLIDEPQGKFLSFLVQTIQAKRVLEIGCFTGYSAICMANGLPAGGMLTTCDIDADTMRFAKTYFERSARSAQIQSTLQDGMAYLDVLGEHRGKDGEEDNQFDLIFVDANKRQYAAYYGAILEKKLLRANGLLVFDNTLFRGRVLASDLGTASSKERLAQGLAKFNSHVADDPRTTQVLLPLWDGLTIVRQV